MVRAAVCGVPALAALGLGLWQISARSFTQDEAATLAATRRPLSSLWATLGHIDAVHGVYYVLIHAVRFAGSSPAVVRFPSALATAAAAALVAALGARLAGGRAGAAAGLLYAVSPPATAYAQHARPFALATALAVLACWRFTVLADSGRRRDAAVYAAAVALAGWVNVLTLLVVPANAVSALCVPRWRGRWRVLAAADAAAGAAAFPIVALGLSQIGQIAWEKPPSAAAWLALGAGAGVCALLAGAALRPGPGRDRAARLAALAAPWLALPPVVVASVSELTPMWQPRYLLFCLPALALLAAAALSRLPPGAGAAVAAACVAAVLAGQPLVRPAVAADNLRAVSRLIGSRSRRGDAVVFSTLGRRLIEDAYPAGFRRVRDVGLSASAASRDSLYGRNVSPAALARRLAATSRLWVVGDPTPRPPRHFATLGHPRAFCQQRTWQLRGSTVTLYLRC